MTADGQLAIAFFVIDYKIASVLLSVSLPVLLKSQFLSDFDEILHRCKGAQKNKKGLLGLKIR